MESTVCVYVHSMALWSIPDVSSPTGEDDNVSTTEDEKQIHTTPGMGTDWIGVMGSAWRWHSSVTLLLTVLTVGTMHNAFDVYAPVQIKAGELILKWDFATQAIAADVCCLLWSTKWV